KSRHFAPFPSVRSILEGSIDAAGWAAFPGAPAHMNLMSIFRKSQVHSRAPGPHMTWAKTSVGRSISRTGMFLKKQLWIWPIIAVVILSTLGLFVRWKIESVMRASLESELQTTRNLEAEMLKTWFNVQKANAESLANNLEVRNLAYPLLDAGRQSA